MTTGELTDLEYFDAAHYRLMVTVDNKGRVEIQHQAHDDNAWADREMARLAAQIDEQVAPEKGRVVIPRTGRGINLMPCAGCGRMLHANQLQWLRSPAHDLGLRRSGNPIPRVGCSDCAKAVR